MKLLSQETIRGKSSHSRVRLLVPQTLRIEASVKWWRSTHINPGNTRRWRLVIRVQRTTPSTKKVGANSLGPVWAEVSRGTTRFQNDVVSDMYDGSIPGCFDPPSPPSVYWLEPDTDKSCCNFWCYPKVFCQRQRAPYGSSSEGGDVVIEFRGTGTRKPQLHTRGAPDYPLHHADSKSRILRA